MSLAESTSPVDPGARTSYRAPWIGVLALVGLDYFSTLAYQPSIAAEAAGPFAPLATAALVLLTCIGALPVYCYIVGNGPPGQGSMALLERRIAGWRGKIIILIILGFAATNFLFTRTLSTADAAVHVIHNPTPGWQSTLDSWAAAGASVQDWSDHPLWKKCCGFWNRQLVVTLLLLILNFSLWPIVWYGFTRRMVQAAIGIVGLFVLLTLVILLSGMVHLFRNGDLWDAWWAQVRSGDWPGHPSWAGSDDWSLVAAALWLLPKMALGLSGFEMSLVVAPLLKNHVPGTRKLLVASAGVMGILLLGSAVVTTLLMVPTSMLPGGVARERALAHIAHGGELAHGLTARDLNPIFGPLFGTLYDIITIVVLCLAGASVSLGLRSLLPQFLLRFGMELRWAYAIGLIYHVFNLINLGVTMIFKASVEAQRAAYAVSVLAVMAGASLAAALDLRRRGGFLNALASIPFALVTLIFGLMMIGIVWERPSCLLIAGLFIVTIIGTSVVSRWWRAKEFRFEGFEFSDDQHRALWDYVRDLPYSVLVPHRPGGHSSLAEKEAKIRKRHRVGEDVPLIFLEIEVDDASDFMQRPVLHIREEAGQYFIRVTQCASVAHVIVAIGLEFSKVGEPPEIHFGWSDEHPLAATLDFLLFGQGNVPALVNDLVRRHVPDHEKRPRVIIG